MKYPKRILNSRIYWEFENLLLTLEHFLGTPLFLLTQLLPRGHFAPPYCYICKKNWFQILDEGVRMRYANRNSKVQA